MTFYDSIECPIEDTHSGEDTNARSLRHVIHISRSNMETECVYAIRI